MKIKVSELIVRYMERIGIECIFGMPGAHILPVYDSLYDSPIQAVLAKHEQGASFMAGGFNRATGKIAACIATAGPGATNLVTGVANAYTDNQPLLLITGETPTYIFGKGGLQESSGEGGSVDQVSLFSGLTRYNRIVERTDYLPQVFNQASRILLSPNPGPVLLSFPFNIQNESVDAETLDRINTSPRRLSLCASTPALDPVAELLLEARHPVIVGGYGCVRSGAQAAVTRLSNTLGIPVATSLKGKGIIDEGSPLSLGSLGVTSSGQAYQYIVERADLLLVLGAGFNERTSYLWDDRLLRGRKIVQIDRDPNQLEKVFEADLAIEGDIRAALEGILDALEERGVATRNAAAPDPVELHGSSGNDYALFQSGFSVVEHFFRLLEEHFPAGAVIFDDNIIFAQNFLRVSEGNRYYPNSGVSSLGHAVPAAIGARFAQAQPTFALLGDGGFQMCCMELMTAVNYDKPVNVVVFNNQTMGLIRKNQHQHYDGRYINCDFVNPDFALLAASFGIEYKRVETAGDLDQLFTGFDLRNRINLVEIVLDRDAFPNYSSKR